MIIKQKVLFDKVECDDIIKLSKTNPQTWESIDRNYNSSTIRYDIETKWIFDKLRSFFEEASGYGMTLLKNEIHFHSYNQNGKFDLHNDARDKRIFSVGVLLNDDFDGGDFNLYSPNKITIDKKVGNCYLFNVEISHEITPIISGTRYSLIWFIQDMNVKTTSKKII